MNPTETPIQYELLNPNNQSFAWSGPGGFTMQDVLAGYQEQFLMKMLIFSIFYLINTFVLLYYVDKMEQHPIKRRILRIFTYFNLAPALYYPVLMIGIYTGWYQ